MPWTWRRQASLWRPWACTPSAAGRRNQTTKFSGTGTRITRGFFSSDNQCFCSYQCTPRMRFILAVPELLHESWSGSAKVAQNHGKFTLITAKIIIFYLVGLGSSRSRFHYFTKRIRGSGSRSKMNGSTTMITTLKSSKYQDNFVFYSMHLP